MSTKIIKESMRQEIYPAPLLSLFSLIFCGKSPNINLWLEECIAFMRTHSVFLNKWKNKVRNKSTFLNTVPEEVLIPGHSQEYCEINFHLSLLVNSVLFTCKLWVDKLSFQYYCILIITCILLFTENSA